MKEQFVTYEIAVKLKELGFDESCIAFYYIFNDEEKFLISTISNTNSSWDNEYISAPLWQQAVDWFREKYNYHIIVDINMEGWFWEIVDALKGELIEQFEFCEIDGNFIYFNSNEEAREQAILKAIELCKK